MFKLSWRQVFDTKIAGTTRDQAASVANEYGYGKRLREQSGVATQVRLFYLLMSGTGQELADNSEVLLGQNLGGCHECPLVAVSRRQEQSDSGDYRLATSHLSLQQPAHWLWFLQVSNYLLEHSLLGLSQGKG